MTLLLSIDNRTEQESLLWKVQIVIISKMSENKSLLIMAAMLTILAYILGMIHALIVVLNGEVARSSEPIFRG